MTLKKTEQQPAPQLRDWQVVETTLRMRRRRLNTAQVAEACGVKPSTIYLMVRRIRWMAGVKLGNGCPIGTVEKNLAIQFIGMWDAWASRARTVRVPWQPMNAEEGRAVSDAMRKVFES